MSMLSNPFSIYFSKKLQRALMESEAQKYAADRHAEAIENAAATNASAEVSRQKLLNATLQMLEKLRTGVDKEKIAAEREKIPLLREIMKAKGIDIGEELAKPGITAGGFAVPEMGGRSWTDDTGAHWEAGPPTKKAAFPAPSGSYWGPEQEEELTQEAITPKKPKQSIADIIQDLYEDEPRKDFWKSIWDRLGDISSSQRQGYF